MNCGSLSPTGVVGNVSVNRDNRAAQSNVPPQISFGNRNAVSVRPISVASNVNRNAINPIPLVPAAQRQQVVSHRAVAQAQLQPVAPREYRVVQPVQISNAQHLQQMQQRLQVYHAPRQQVQHHPLFGYNAMQQMNGRNLNQNNAAHSGHNNNVNPFGRRR